RRAWQSPRRSASSGRRARSSRSRPRSWTIPCSRRRRSPPTSSRPTRDRMTSALLELDNVTKRFGRVVIAEDLSFAVGPGEVVGIVRGVNAEGITVIWIEHVVRALTAVVGRLICLAGGKFVGDGEPATVLADPAVREVFLGTEVTAALAGGSLEAPPAAPGDGAVDGERSEP